MSNVNDLINAIQFGTDEDANVAFQDVVATKVSAALDAKRIDVASKIYSREVDTGEVDVEL